MAAPKGNQFWKIRAKHGRDRLFASPELLLEAANEYFQWCEDNPLIQVDFKGKDATRVELPRMRPYTIQALTIYLQCDVGYFLDFKQSLAGKSDEESKNFSRVIAYIEGVIYSQKYEGAASGFLNPMIIARDLGLAEKTHNEQSGHISINVAPGDDDLGSLL